MGLSDRLNTFNIKRGISYLKRNGVKKTCYKVAERLKRDDEEAGYMQVMLTGRPTAEELKAQKLRSFFHDYKFSILVPAYNTDPVFLKDMIMSVVRQTYPDWELCIADGSDNDTVRDEVERIKQGLDKDVADRIRYKKLSGNKGISGNLNDALVMATGDYVGFLDHDDILTPDALYEVMSSLDSGIIRDGNIYRNRYLALYTDEDKVSYTLSRYFDPHIKPDFDIDLLRSNNYICHFFVVKTSVAIKAGGFKSEYNGAQDHDFILRCAEILEPSQICHIPKVLYHWRSSLTSTAENPDSKLYAYEAGKRAVKDHLKRLGIKACVTDTDHLGFYRVRYVPGSLNVKKMTKSEWDALDRETFDAIDDDFIMIMGEGLSPISDDYIEELAGTLTRPEVGAVGGKIYDKHGRIDSAGYTRVDGVLKADFRGMNGNFSGYLHRASIQRKTDSLAADCMMVKKEAVIFNDKPMMSDRFITVYDPYAEFRRK
ncbi:MAG: glycosyltransferase [Lachnospiraceae bacterium]|nr:glycosyltransferase [Lachnospiraceae bacterium]